MSSHMKVRFVLVAALGAWVLASSWDAQADDQIKLHEGYRSQAYPDAGRWAICYGSTRGVTPGMRATEEECLRRFDEDMATAEAAIERSGLRLTASQFRALRSFIHNAGPGAFMRSTLLRRARAGDCRGAAQEFHRWVYSQGKVVPGLVKVRAWEAEQFSKGCRP